MATWLTHLRIAEIVYSKLSAINDAPLFFVGSIAPDNGSEPDITHRCVGGDKSTCDINGFYREYILNSNSQGDINFYYGYYVHLYTDLIWQKQIIAPLIMQGGDIKTLKQTWKKADLQFLTENNEYLPIKMLSQAKNIEKKWFDYCDVLTVKSLRDDIIALSKQRSTDKMDADAQIEIDNFINTCAGVIINNPEII